MSPRRTNQAAQPAGIPIADLQRLKARIDEKAASYRSTATAYRSKCFAVKKLEIEGKAKVVDMLGGWVQEIIDGYAPEQPQAQSPDTQYVQSHAPTQATAKSNSGGQSADDPERSDQEAGSVDVSGLRSDNG